MVDISADLKAEGIAAYQQGTAPRDLPETFVTVWEYPSENITHGDNKPTQCRREWEIVFYTTDAAQIYSGLEAVIKALKKRGYATIGQGGDASGTWEGYNARAVDVVKIENLED